MKVWSTHKNLVTYETVLHIWSIIWPQALDNHDQTCRVHMQSWLNDNKHCLFVGGEKNSFLVNTSMWQQRLRETWAYVSKALALLRLFCAISPVIPCLPFVTPTVRLLPLLWCHRPSFTPALLWLVGFPQVAAKPRRAPQKRRLTGSTVVSSHRKKTCSPPSRDYCFIFIDESSMAGT